MFKCQSCGKVVPPGTKAHYHVAEKRVKYYARRYKANQGFKLRGMDRIKSNRREDRLDDPGGKGWEIVREIKVCPKCKEKLEQETPDTD